MKHQEIDQTQIPVKTHIITGANSGIGLATALALAQRGDHAVMVCRSRERGEAARREILARLDCCVGSGGGVQGPRQPQVDLIIADLSSLRDVKRLARELTAKCPRIDSLILNAGVFLTERRESVDGIELTLATNHISHVVLVDELRELLRRSGHAGRADKAAHAGEAGHAEHASAAVHARHAGRAGARVIIVSSAMHKRARLDLSDLEYRVRKYSAMRAYAQSKLLNLMYMKSIAAEFEKINATINCLHPGDVATSIGSGNDDWLLKVLAKLVRPFLATAELGAETSVYLATSAEVAQTTGEYFVKKAQRSLRGPANHDAVIEAAMTATWQIIERATRASE